MDTTTQPNASLKTNGFKGILWKVLLVIFIVLGLLFYWFYYNSYSDGERIGMLTKLSRKGNVFKTYEGEMLIGNVTANSAGLANEKFYFSVADKQLADTLMKIQGQRVALTYKQYRKTLFWRGDCEYVIVGYSKIAP